MRGATLVDMRHDESTWTDKAVNRESALVLMAACAKLVRYAASLCGEEEARLTGDPVGDLVARLGFALMAASQT